MSADAKKRRRFNPDRDVRPWKGAYVPYDILKEAFVAFLAVLVLIRSSRSSSRPPTSRRSR